MQDQFNDTNTNVRSAATLYPISQSFMHKIISNKNHITTCTKLNSVALVRERTIPTERPPPVGEVSANFCG